MTTPGRTTPEQRLAELGITLGAPPPPAGHYVPVRRYADVVTTASISSKQGGTLRHLGLLGADLDVPTGQQSARGAMINCLAAVRSEIGSLDLVSHVVRITGYVASAPGFLEQHTVMNGASDLAIEVFGEEAGRHVRAAVGVAAMPNNCSVGVELTVALARPDSDDA